MRKLFNFSLFALLLLFLAACETAQSPGGGDTDTDQTPKAEYTLASVFGPVTHVTDDGIYTGLGGELTVSALEPFSGDEIISFSVAHHDGTPIDGGSRYSPDPSFTSERGFGRATISLETDGFTKYEPDEYRISVYLDDDLLEVVHYDLSHLSGGLEMPSDGFQPEAHLDRVTLSLGGLEAGFVTVSLVDTAADSALVGGAEEVGPGNDVITLDLDADFELTRRGDYVLQVNADSNPYSEEHSHTSAQFLQHSRSVAITEEPVLTLTVINTAQNPTDNAYFLMPLLSFPLGAPEYSPDAVTQGFKIDYVPSAGLGTTPMTAIWNEGDRSIVGQRLTFEENPPLGDPDFILRNVNISVGINGEEYSATLDAPANNATLAPIKGFDFRYVENSIVVEWDPVGGADNYIVFVHSSGNRVYFEMTTDTELTVHNSDEFPVTSDPNNLYQIQVIAVDSDPLIPETRALSGSHAHGLLDTYP